MRVGGIGTEGGIGAGGEVFCSMRFLVSIDHGGRRRPTAAMVPHSRCRRIRQSANSMSDCCMWRRREWDTMTAVVGRLGHDVSKDVVGCCDMCFAR